jgi:hypothetical protein
MPPFRYTYQGKTYESRAEHFTQDGYNRYRVTLGNDLWLVIAPSGIPGQDGKNIWVQSNKPGEVIQPHDLVQSLGEGLESAGIKET